MGRPEVKCRGVEQGKQETGRKRKGEGGEVGASD